MNMITIPEEKFNRAEQHGSQVLDYAKSVEITNEEDFQTAQEYFASVAKSEKAVRSFINSIIKPHKDAVKETESRLKPLLVPYKEGKELLQTKLNSFIAKKREAEQKAAEEERKKREAEEARNKARMNELLELGFAWNPQQGNFFMDKVAAVTPDKIKNADSDEWETTISFLKEEIDKLPKEEVKPAEKPKVEDLPSVKPDPVPVAKEKIQTKTQAGSVHTRKTWTFKEVDFDKIPKEFLQVDTKAVNEAIKDGVREIPGLEIFQEERIVARTS